MRDRPGAEGSARFVTQQRPRRSAAGASWLVEYAFAIRCDADREALLDAEASAHQWGVPFLQALFAGDRISEDRFALDLAGALGVPFASDDIRLPEPIAGYWVGSQMRDVETAMGGLWRGTPVLMLCATAVSPALVAQRVAQARMQAARQRPERPVVLVTGRALSAAAERARAKAHVTLARSALKRRLPLYSAGRPGPVWQPLVLALVPLLMTFGLLAAPRDSLDLLLVVLALPFAGTSMVRLVALIGQVRPTVEDRRAARPALPRTPDYELPVYSILVALFDEATVLPDLIAALLRLDYPPAKLDCLLIIEDVDAPTKLAFLGSALPIWMRIVIVPAGAPRTKPRALNYALQLARGAYVVVYDAEDRPEPDQLRRAVAAFRRGGRDLACVQACLNIYNARQSWLTRQFTVEYSSLFDAILPALQRLRLPIPLGGTSNHFPRALLETLHGWDPYNVTEDADLGIRIARLGHRVALITSTTWEEAPPSFRMWLRQRTRWLKGWMQTYLVHTRRPIALVKDFGLLRALGFHLYLGGLILSALVHPLFYGALIVDACFDIRPEGGEGGFGAGLGHVLWLVAVANLVAGYLTSIVVGMIAARRRGHRLTISALLMPFYWLLISLAAYRALWQLYRDPFVWEKTPHGLAEED